MYARGSIPGGIALDELEPFIWPACSVLPLVAQRRPNGTDDRFSDHSWDRGAADVFQAQRSGLACEDFWSARIIRLKRYRIRRFGCWATEHLFFHDDNVPGLSRLAHPFTLESSDNNKTQLLI